MEKIGRLFIILSALFFFNSCDKENAPECFQSTGEVDSLVYNPAEEVLEIILNDNIGIHLSNSDSDESSFSLSGGKNLLNDISFEIENGVLTISNENKCNWTRKYSDFTLQIESNSLQRIYNYGSKGLIMEDFNSSDFTFEQESSLADNYLNFTGERLVVNFHSSAGFAELKGSADNLFLYTNGISSIDASGISSPSISANNSGRTNLITAPTAFMFAYIGGSGSIVHNNLSANITTEIVGSGVLEYANY